jgi:hypothetical protein
MSEFGTQYNGLQGFAYSATAIINALAQLNNTISSLSVTIPLQTVYFNSTGTTINNTNSSKTTYTFGLNKATCPNPVGFILNVKSTNHSSVLLNGVIELKPGTTFVLTVEQNRIFDVSSVTVTLEPGDSVSYLPICVS